MKKNNNKTFKKISLIASSLTMMVAVPVMAAILVQNFITNDVNVQNPPIVKVAGADAATSSFLTVDLGGTISNEDDTLGTPGTNPTLLSNEQVTFSCFQGDRTYYTDVIQLQNVTGTEDWDVTLTVEEDLQGNAETETTFADSGADGSDADIWLFTSSADSTTAITSLPNPGNYGSLADWQDAAAPDGAIQLEVTDTTPAAIGGVSFDVVSDTTGPFTIGAGEQRQLALVVDCGANMADEVGTGNTGTFRLTVAATPN